MSREAHLRLLAIFHYVLAAIFYLLAGLFVLLWAIPGLVAIVHGESLGWLFFVGGLLCGGLTGLVAHLHRRSGSAVVRGRGRILQTVLALLQLCNMPFGTAFGVYTLYLCWFHQPTKVFFDVQDSRL